MILDSSAVVAIFKGEDDAADLAARIEAAPEVAISAASVVELAVVLGSERREALDQFLEAARVVVVPVDDAQVDAARSADERFGRRSGSRAKLNFGDLFPYALAAVTRRPLLCKGNDFVHTDIELAAPTARS